MKLLSLYTNEIYQNSPQKKTTTKQNDVYHIDDTWSVGAIEQQSQKLDIEHVG